MPQSITGLSPRAAEFLTTLASQARSIFTSEEARVFWGTSQVTGEALSRLSYLVRGGTDFEAAWATTIDVLRQLQSHHSV